MYNRRCRVVAILILLWAALFPAMCEAQQDALRTDYRCNPLLVSMADARQADGWQPLSNSGVLVERGAGCWLRIAKASPATVPATDYLILPHSPMLQIALFDSHGRALALGIARHDTGGALKLGRYVLVPMADLADGPLYVKADSSNRAYLERVAVRGPTSLPAALAEQEHSMLTTLMAGTLLMTSAMFTAAFALALRDREFGAYAGYSMALSLSLLAYGQMDGLLFGVHYGWLCWLAMHFGRFRSRSVWLVRALYVVIAVDVALLAWALLTLAGMPLPMLHFNRFEFENYQDLAVEFLIMLGGWLGWRRGEQDRQDCLLLMFSLMPSLFIDLVNLIWTPVVAPWLLTHWGFALPPALDHAIHFNGALTWLPLPAMFCFVLARRALHLHTALVSERNQLEARVEYRTRDLRRANRELELLATTDGLTGLLNRRRMMEWLDHEILRARRHGHALTLCMVDIDHFKHVNDCYGHMAGDRALVAIAGVLTRSMRSIDLIARFGGEEFVLLLTETDFTVAVELVERLRASVAAQVLQADDGRSFSMTISVGVAALEADDEQDSVSRLLVRADQALYRAKNGGRNCVMVA